MTFTDGVPLKGVGPEHIRDKSIGTAQISDDAIGTAQLQPDSVTASEIATDAVGTSEIAANAVGASELADNAVDTAAIQDAAVTEVKIVSTMPRAAIAQQILTTNDGPYTTDTVTDFVLNNVPVVQGHLYGLHLHTGATNNTSGTRWDLILRLNGTAIDRFAVLENRTGTTSSVTADATCYWTAPTTQATDDFDILADEITDGAAFTLFAAATAPRTFTIIDLGVI